MTRAAQQTYNATTETFSLRWGAACLISVLKGSPSLQIKLASAPPVGKGSIFTLLARQNVSLDEEYAKRKAKKGVVATFKHKHSVPAMQLVTLPPRCVDMRDYEHRPRGVWLPPPSKGRAKAGEPAIFQTLPWCLLTAASQQLGRSVESISKMHCLLRDQPVNSDLSSGNLCRRQVDRQGGELGGVDQARRQ